MSVGNQTPAGLASDYAAQSFHIDQMISQISTTTLARVIECTNDGGIVPTGTLKVEILVNMLTGAGEAKKHAPIYEVPYKRIQGGANAVILDPSPGDIGVIGFCERDISAVKTARGVANPGSRRKYSKSDGVWLATVWAAQAPAQYIVFNSSGISIVSPTEITLQAPLVRILGELQQSNGDASFAQSVEVAADVTAQGEVTAGNIPLTTHKHGGVTPGGGTSGTPVP